jgi:hypothetical protein
MGALTNKISSFQYRPWELTSVKSQNPYDYYGQSLQLEVRGIQFLRILPLEGDEWIKDNIRFAYLGYNNKNRINGMSERVLLSLFYRIVPLKNKDNIIMMLTINEIKHVYYPIIYRRNWVNNVYYEMDQIAKIQNNKKILNLIIDSQVGLIALSNPIFNYLRLFGMNIIVDNYYNTKYNIVENNSIKKLDIAFFNNIQNSYDNNKYHIIYNKTDIISHSGSLYFKLLQLSLNIEDNIYIYEIDSLNDNFEFILKGYANVNFLNIEQEENNKYYFLINDHVYDKYMQQINYILDKYNNIEIYIYPIIVKNDNYINNYHNHTNNYQNKYIKYNLFLNNDRNINLISNHLNINCNSHNNTVIIDNNYDYIIPTLTFVDYFELFKKGDNIVTQKPIGIWTKGIFSLITFCNYILYYFTIYYLSLHPLKLNLYYNIDMYKEKPYIYRINKYQYKNSTSFITNNNKHIIRIYTEYNNIIYLNNIQYLGLLQKKGFEGVGVKNFNFFTYKKR